MAPTAIEKEVERRIKPGLSIAANKIRKIFLKNTLSMERIIRHPSAAALSEAAHKKLFFEPDLS